MDWGELGENIQAVSIGYFLLLLFFIGFMIFAVLNILTGVFVDKALEISQDDCGTNQVAKLLERNRMLIQQFIGLFYTIRKAGLDQQGNDVDNASVNIDDAVSLEKFEEQHQNPDIQATFVTLGLDIQEPRVFFKLLSSGGARLVSLHDFVQGCMSLRGQAHGVQVQALRDSVRQLAGDVRWLRKHVAKMQTVELAACELGDTDRT